MKVLFCWTDISGYMAACWRALASREGVDLHVLAYDSSAATEFRGSLMEGIAWTPLRPEDRHDSAAVQAAVQRQAADVVVIAGWSNPAYRRIPFLPSAVARPTRIMAMDTPWRGTLRQRVARFALGRYLAALDAAWVPGERGWRFARQLGFREDRILRGVYGFDWEPASKAWEARKHNPSWPRRFLFIGRYAAEKGVDLLVEGYRAYRRQVESPWDLACCGIGPLATKLRNVEGVIDRGFQQPDELAAEMGGSGVILAPSRYDPWNVAIMEAAAAGLPVFCSDACGASVELVHEGLTGHVFAADSAEAVTKAMLTAHREPRLAEMGEAAREAAAHYRADCWADRFVTFARRLQERRS